MTSSELDATPSCRTEDFVAALSLAANGVAIVTTDGRSGKAGLTVSSMVSVCADPPLMLACVNSANEFCGMAEANGVFALNLLAQDQQNLSNVFAGFAENPEADRFVSGNWAQTVTGSPVLNDALVSLDCTLVDSYEHGTHRIYIGRVVSVSTRNTAPLVYSRRGYARIV